MKTNKTYATLAGAYTAVEKAKATPFDNNAYYTQICVCIGRAIKGGKEANKIALWNLVKYEKTLCALECTKEGTYKWTAIGHFDSDGLLYPAGTEAPAKVIEDKTTPRKRTRKAKGDNKPTKTEWQTELDAYAGKGRQANHKVAKILRKHKMSAQIGSEGWNYWENIR